MNFKNLLFVFFTLVSTFLVAQTTIISDNETGDTTHVFAFGNGHFGDSTFAVVPNPTPNAVNGSANVQSWCEGHDGNGWAGFGYNVETLDFTGDVAEICISVLITHSAKIRIKSTGSTTGGPQIRIEKDYTTPNEWQKICFDFANDADINGNVGLAMSHLYSRFDIYLDYNVDITADDCYYFDDILINENGDGLYVDPDQWMISNNEPGEDTTHVFAFGNGHFGDSTFMVVANPDTTGYNSSAHVRAWCEANDANTWGGFGYVLDTIDFTGDKAEVCISILADHAATLRLQAKGSTTGPAVKTAEEYTTPGLWQQICFDMTQDGNVNGANGQGHIYTRMDFYLDYGPAPAADDCYYFDNLLLNENGTGVLPQLVENLVNNNSDLSEFRKYVTATDLWGELNKDGVTVFAPTNAAFAALSAADRAALDDNTDNATYNMVMHHLAKDSLPAGLLVDGTVFILENGQNGTVSGTSVNGANVSSSLDATNGFMHIVDAVLAFPAEPDTELYSDFEGGGSEADNEGWYYWWTIGSKAIDFVENPHKDAANNSDNVMEYRRFPRYKIDPISGDTIGETKWWQGFAYKNERNYNFYGELTKVCFDVYAEEEGEHWMFLKLDKALTPNTKYGSIKSFQGQSWQTVCFDAAEPDWYDAAEIGLNNIYPGTVLYFDTEVANVWPADTTTFYIDNWRTQKILVGTNNISKLENFGISPNPTFDFINVSSTTPIKTATVFDITGRVLFSATDPVHNDLDVSALKAGMYFIRFVGYNGEAQGAIRFVKQ